MNRFKRAGAWMVRPNPDPVDSWCVVAAGVVLAIGVACVAIWWPR